MASDVRQYAVEAETTSTFGRVLCSARNHHFVIDGPVQHRRSCDAESRSRDRVVPPSRRPSSPSREAGQTPALHAREIAPNLPILHPEFGVAGGDGATLTERQQVELLQRMIGELATANPAALVYYQPFDMNYLGQPQFFKDA